VLTHSSSAVVVSKSFATMEPSNAFWRACGNQARLVGPEVAENISLVADEQHALVGEISLSS
jgi:hypothetical protein